MGINFSSIFKYMGLAMEAARQAAVAKAEIDKYKDPASEGGKEITHDEYMHLAVDLQDNFSEVATRICQEFKLPVKSVTVNIELEV